MCDWCAGAEPGGVQHILRAEPAVQQHIPQAPGAPFALRWVAARDLFAAAKRSFGLLFPCCSTLLLHLGH